jgi:hypothetical protein
MANVFQLNLVGVVGGEYVENILHYDAASVGTNTPEQIAADLIMGWSGSLYESNYLACLPSDYVLAGYRCKSIYPSGGSSVVKPRSSAVGTRPTASVASGISPICVFPIYNIGNPKRDHTNGKLFMPGVADGDLNGNIWSDALQAAISAFISQLLIAITGTLTTYTYGVYNRSTHAFVAADVGNLSLTVGTQRRRYRPVL